MTGKLAGLVLPDSTPVERRPQKTDGRKVAPVGKRRIWRRRTGPGPRARRSSSLSRSDWVVAGSGMVLAFACAVFPWYIFFNQEDFGTRPVTFRGNPALALPQSASIDVPSVVGERLALPFSVFPDLDMAATGTVKPGGAATTLSETEQPFPGAKPDFKLVLVANGRAMIADKDGYWVVQPGSWLPDGSRVSALEKQGDGWVLVTSHGADIPISK